MSAVWPLDDPDDPWADEWPTTIATEEALDQHERRRLQPADPLPTTADLCRIGTDYSPALGNDAPGLLLGPWALTASPAVLQVAVAHLAMARASLKRPSPVRTWGRNQPRPSVAERAAIRAVDHTPLSLWKRDGNGLRDLVGLARGFIPEGSVQVEPIVHLGPPNGGGVIAARVLPTASGWAAFGAIEIPGHPPASRIRRWRDEVVAQAIAAATRATVETALMWRGHVLVRRAAEWAWSA
jgi:hypothetical protein